MRAMRSGKRTVVEVAGSGFAVAAVLTIGKEKTTGLPGCEDAKKVDVLLVAALGTGGNYDGRNSSC